MGISETVLAAMIGAIATIGTAIFQLVINWKKQAGDRRVASKGGIRSLLWVVTLMLASGVGGFAYSEYLSQGRREETHELRQELRQQLQTLAASTSRLEQVRLNAQSVVDSLAAVVPGGAPPAALWSAIEARLGVGTGSSNAEWL